MAGVRVALVALAATPVCGFFLDHRPRIWGGSYSFSGRGERPEDAFFAPGDVYTDVCVIFWRKWAWTCDNGDVLTDVMHAGRWRTGISMGLERCSSRRPCRDCKIRGREEN